jgi:carbonic anhydrase
MMKFACFLVLCYVTGLQAAGYGYPSDNKDWNYLTDNSANAQQNWWKKYSKCNDNRQSPINIQTRRVTLQKNIGNVTTFGYGEKTKWKMTHKTHTVSFTPTQLEKAEMPYIMLQAKEYELHDIVVHWGDSKNYFGSEHAINSQKYVGEIQMVHYNKKYASYADAKTKSDGLAIWAHLLQMDSEDKVADADIDPFFTGLGWIKWSGDDTTTSYRYSLNEILPTWRPDFWQAYVYGGSITTPPCTENVQWIVNKVPISVSYKQMEHFWALKDKWMTLNSNDEPLVNNYRLTHNKNSRWVYANFDKDDMDDYVCSAGVSVKPFYAVALTFIACLFLRM